MSEPRPILNKIPGELPKRQPEQYVEDLNKLTRVQLLEIKQREEKLLAKKSQIANLTDKGKRIRDFYEKVLKELSYRDEIEQAVERFSDLNVASSGQTKLVNLEWTGRCEPHDCEMVLDSDDEDETNPLKIIAQSTAKKKVIAQIPPEKSLITDEDLKEIESFKDEAVGAAEVLEIDVKEKINPIKPKLEDKLNYRYSSDSFSSASMDLDPHVLYLFKKGVGALPKAEKYKPYKTTKTNVHDPLKEVLRKVVGKTLEESAVTPHPLQHPGVKLLSLQQSFELEGDFWEKYKKLRELQVEERLGAGQLKSSQSEVEHLDLDSDEEVKDEEEERGGVSYVVYK